MDRRPGEAHPHAPRRDPRRARARQRRCRLRARGDGRARADDRAGRRGRPAPAAGRAAGRRQPRGHLGVRARARGRARHPRDADLRGRSARGFWERWRRGRCGPRSSTNSETSRLWSLRASSGGAHRCAVCSHIAMPGCSSSGRRCRCSATGRCSWRSACGSRRSRARTPPPAWCSSRLCRAGPALAGVRPGRRPCPQAAADDRARPRRCRRAPHARVRARPRAGVADLHRHAALRRRGLPVLLGPVGLSHPAPARGAPRRRQRGAADLRRGHAPDRPAGGRGALRRLRRPGRGGHGCRHVRRVGRLPGGDPPA